MKRLMFGMKRLKFKIGGGTVRRMAEVAVDVCFYASLALLGYIFLAVFVCSSFKIPSDSMMPALLRKRSIPSTLLDIRQIRNQENSFLTFEVGYTSLIAHGARDS